MAVSAAAPRLIAQTRAALRDRYLWIGTAAYAALYFALGCVRYFGHRNFVDLGIFAQTAASAFGCFCNTVEGSHWAFHFSPILYAAGALMRAWPSAISLIALQAIAGALVIPAIYGIVFRHTDRRAARLSALVVWLYPPLAGVVFNDFHENGFAPAAAAWLLWAFDGGHAVAMLIFAALVLATKEDQAAFLVIGGALGFIRYRGSWPLGPLAAAISLAALAVLSTFFFVIQPDAAHAAHWAPARFYAWQPSDWAALVPGGILARLGFLLLAFAPLLFLPFRSRFVILTLPALAEVLFSRDSTTFTLGSHYAGAWAGYVLFAFASALGPIFARNPERAYRLLYGCIAVCVVEFGAADPLHPGYFLLARSQRDARLDRFLQTLPPGASIATQEEAYTHLAATDPNAGVLPEKAQDGIGSCDLLTDAAYPLSPRFVESAPLVRALVARGVYRVAQRDGEITLYRKRKSAGCR